MDKLLLGLIGLAIGDALGVPVEFQSRKTLEEHPVRDMREGGTWNQPKGTWSDDTAMTLATLDALGKFNWSVTDNCLLEIMKNFSDWYLSSRFAAGNYRFDIGNTCRDAIVNYMNLKENYLDSLKESRLNEKYGNGALMRILPCLFIQDSGATRKISSLTHNNFVCDTASEYYVAFVKGLIVGKTKEESYLHTTICLGNTLKSATNDEKDRFARLCDTSFKDLSKDKIRSSGYVVETLEAAIWCFMNTDNFIDCVLTAVNLGEDTDTVGAIAGSIAGIYYGYATENGIPKSWLKQLRDLDLIFNIVQESCNSINKTVNIEV